MTAPQLVTRSAFATLCGVDKSRVSHWLKDGLIDGPAVVGTGRAARIDVEKAQAQIASRRDPGQILGNGAKTKLHTTPAGPSPKPRTKAPATSPEPDPDGAEPAGLDDLDPDSLEYQAQRARLVKAQADAQERKNAEAEGELIPLAEAKEGWAMLVSAFRSRMLAVPKRMRDAIPALTPADLAKLEAEVREALTELGRATFLA